MDKLRDFLDRKPVIALDFEAELRQMVADFKWVREALEFSIEFMHQANDHFSRTHARCLPLEEANLALTQTEKYLPLFEEVKL